MLAAETLIRTACSEERHLHRHAGLERARLQDTRALQNMLINRAPNSAAVTPAMGAYIKNLLGKINADLAK